jgi:hypothetical protein
VTRIMRSFLSRRPPRRPIASALAVLLLYVVIAVAAMGANPASETLAPMDLLLEFRGWDAVPHPDGVLHWQRSDILDHYLPQWLHIHRSLDSGDSVLWNPYVSGGIPGVQNLASGSLSPVMWPFFLAPDPALGLYLVSLLKLVGCGLGVFLLLRAWVCPAAAFFGGTTFMLTGFNAAWFPWPHVATAMWIPWLLWAVVGSLRSGGLRWIVAVTAFSTLMILGGFPAVAVYGGYSVVLLLIVWQIAERRETRATLVHAASVIGGVALALVVCAWPIAGLWELLAGIDLSGREGGTSLLFPNDLTTFIAPLHPASRDVERTAYAGIVAALFVAFALVVGWRRVKRSDRPLLWFATTLLTLAVVIAFELVPRALIVLIPTFRTNAYNRLTSVIGLALAVLAAYGLDGLLAVCDRATGNKKRLFIGVLAMACVVQLVDSTWVFRRFNSVTPRAIFYPTTPSLDYVVEHTLPLQSAVADYSFLFGGTLTAYGISEWYAHHFRSNAEKALLSQMVADPFVSDTAAKVGADALKLDSPLWATMAIRFVLVSSEADVRFDAEKWKKHSIEPRVDVMENLAAPPGAFMVGDLSERKPRAASLTTNRLSNIAYEVTYDDDEPGHVVLPMRRYSGWAAYVDGERVEADAYLGALVAVPVGGRSRIEYRYEHATLRPWAWLSALGVAVWVVMALLAVWRRREEVTAR